MSLEVTCLNCGRPYPEQGAPYACPKCGGLFDVSKPWNFDPAQVDRSQPGLWRYRHTFELPEDSAPVSLGEGITPLVWCGVLGRQVAFKAEYLNPTGSFKDRGTSPLVTFLKSRGIDVAIEDSSGNAGASFAAYAARAGIKASVYVPASSSGPKRKQIEAYGATLFPIPGSRTDVSEAVKKAAGTGTTYASHAYLPFNLPGYATAAYEIFEQLGAIPAAVVTPAGQGGLFLGLSRGFDALRRAGLTLDLPRMIGVQARACAPLWAMSTMGPKALEFVTEGNTLAEGIKTRFPLRGDAILQAAESSGGSFVVVDEADILRGRDELAAQGFYVEPTSAVVWSALEQILPGCPDPVVVMLTGSGYKAAIG